MKAAPLDKATGVRRPGVAAVLMREFTRIASRRVYVLMTLVLPLLTFGLLTAIFNAGTPRKLPIAVYDADNSNLSRRLVRLLDAASTLSVTSRVTDLKEGRESILSGKSYALVVLPHDLERDLSRRHGAKVTSYFNNQLMSAGSIVNRGIRETLKTVAVEMDQRRREQRAEGVKAARTHAEPIVVESRALFNPYLNYLYFLVGALMPNMLQIFVILVAVYALGIELKEGTAREWLETAGGSPWKAVVGKLAPYTAGFLLMGLFMNTLLFLHLGVPLRGSVTLIATGTVLLVLAYQSMALFIVSATANLRMSLSLAALYSAPAFAFAGITFPVMAMPPLGKIWGMCLPISHYLIVFLDQGMRGAPVAVSLPQMFALSCFLFAAPLAVPRLGKAMADESYWGRR